jgi:predicted dinucleotide-binding enzyme
LRIGILGTGVMAAALAEAWARSGHRVLVGGRSLERAEALAGRLGPEVTAADPARVAEESEAVLVAVAWEGVDEVLALAGAQAGSLAGKAVLDCTNAVDFATGLLRSPTGSVAEQIAARAVGAQVVKALHLYAGVGWLTPPAAGQPPRTVALCGDHEAALATAATLVRDLGGVPAVLGGLAHARQLEGVAGFVMGLVAAGHNPATAVPVVEQS